MDAIPRRCLDCGKPLTVIYAQGRRKARKHLAHFSCPNKADLTTHTAPTIEGAKSE